MININLIANRRSQKLREMVMLRWAVISVLLLAVGMALLNVMALLDYATAVGKLATTQDKLKMVQDDKIGLDKVQAKIEEKRPQVILLKQAQQSQEAWLIILADISHILRNDVVLTTLSSGRSDKSMTLTMGGYATDERTVAQLILDLREKTKWAGNPKPGTVSANMNEHGERTVHFDLTVPIEGMLGGDL